MKEKRESGMRWKMDKVESEMWEANLIVFKFEFSIF